MSRLREDQRMSRLREDQRMSGLREDQGMSSLREDQRAQARVAQVARDSYGRLLAVLAAPTRDIATAEDALADALERALARWPDDGIPVNPEGWLLTVARHQSGR